MNIVYSASDYYAECTGVSMYSLLKHNKTPDVHIYVLSAGISEENCQKLHEVAKQFDTPLDIIDAEAGFLAAAEKYHFQIMRGSYNTYARIILNQWLNFLDKVIVVDSDTLVCDDLGGLWALEMGEMLYAAVPEISMYGKYSNFDDREIVYAHEFYYNAGICMVNLKGWREARIDAMLEKVLPQDKTKFMCSEQSIMNKYFGDQFVRMPLRYNFYPTFHYVRYETLQKVFNQKTCFSYDEYLEAKEKTVIIHYCGLPYERPWFENSVSYKQELYLAERSETPWRDVPLKRWHKRGSMKDLYDYVCYFLLRCRLYTLCLKFRLVFAQMIKGAIRRGRK